MQDVSDVLMGDLGREIQARDHQTTEAVLDPS